MSVSKDTASCVGGIVGGVIIIFIIIVFVLPIIGPFAAQQVSEEGSETIPGFDSFTFLMSIVCLFPIALILIKKKIVKKSE